MIRRIIAASALCSLFATPASAEMSIATFLAKADGLKAKGMLAMMSPDFKSLMAEMNVVQTGYRAEIKSAKAARRPLHSCPPAKATVNSDELLAHFRTIPTQQRPETSVKTGFYGLMKKRYPCPA
ncbi:MAG: hypothetical protein ABL918_08700 [Chakrabartia sp.]